MRPRPADLAVAAASAALFLACVGALWADLRSVGGTEGERVGSLVLKKRVAQRRPAGRTVWTGLSVNDELRSGEAIRTDAGSEAVVLLDDGTELVLAENSLVLLEFESGGASLEFVSGAVSARRDAVEADAPALKVRAAGIDLALGSGSLELSGGGGAVEARSPSGTATARLEGVEVRLSGNAGISADPAGSRALSWAVVPSTPAPGAVLFHRGGGGAAEVGFAWSGGAAPWSIEVSRTRDFLEALAFESYGTTASVVLEPGAWHWRVRDASGATSPISRFSVFSSAPPVLLGPRAGASFGSEENVALSWSAVDGAAAYECELSGPGEEPEPVRIPGVGYTWSTRAAGDHAWRVRAVFGYGGADSGDWSEPRVFTVRSAEPAPAAADASAPVPVPDAIPAELLAPADGAWFEAGAELTLARGAGGGRLLVWRSDDTGAPIADYGETATSARFVPPEPGAYLWGVDGGDGLGERRVFTVLAPLGAPALASPEPGAELDVPEARSLAVSWTAVEGAVSYRVTVRAAAEAGSALERSTSATELEIRGASLEPGAYVWRVVAEGTDPDGNARFGPPATGSFSVVRGGPLDAPVPIAPEPGGVADLSRAVSLDFSWKAVDGANRYELELRDARGRLVVRRALAGTSWSFAELARLDRGRYAVTVAASYVAGDGVRERSGPTAAWTFEVRAEDPREAPVLITPKEIYVLDD